DENTFAWRNYRPLSAFGKLADQAVANTSDPTGGAFLKDALGHVAYGLTIGPFVQAKQAWDSGDSVAFGEGLFNSVLTIVPVLKGASSVPRGLRAVRESGLKSFMPKEIPSLKQASKLVRESVKKQWKNEKAALSKKFNKAGAALSREVAGWKNDAALLRQGIGTVSAGTARRATVFSNSVGAVAQGVAATVGVPAGIASQVVASTARGVARGFGAAVTASAAAIGKALVTGGTYLRDALTGRAKSGGGLAEAAEVRAQATREVLDLLPEEPPAPLKPAKPPWKVPERFSGNEFVDLLTQSGSDALYREVMYPTSMLVGSLLKKTTQAMIDTFQASESLGEFDAQYSRISDPNPSAVSNQYELFAKTHLTKAQYEAMIKLHPERAKEYRAPTKVFEDGPHVPFAESLEARRIVVDNRPGASEGAMVWAHSGEPVVNAGKSGEFLYVRDAHGNMFGFEGRGAAQNWLVKHSSFFGKDGAVSAAGTLVTDANGFLTEISNSSGHFGLDLGNKLKSLAGSDSVSYVDLVVYDLVQRQGLKLLPGSEAVVRVGEVGASGKFDLNVPLRKYKVPQPGTIGHGVAKTPPVATQIFETPKTAVANNPPAPVAAASKGNAVSSQISQSISTTGSPIKRTTLTTKSTPGLRFDSAGEPYLELTPGGAPPIPRYKPPELLPGDRYIDFNEGIKTVPEPQVSDPARGIYIEEYPGSGLYRDPVRGLLMPIPDGVSPLTSNPNSNSSNNLSGLSGGVFESTLRSAWERLRDSALDAWNRISDTDMQLDLNLIVADLDNNVLGYAEITSLGEDGRPTAGRITIDATGAGRGWFIDMSPEDASEFYEENTSVSGKFDLYTFVLHEVGHLLGFTDYFSGFAAGLVTAEDGSMWFDSGDVRLSLESDGEHTGVSDGLMNSHIAPGVRRQPSVLEGAILREAWRLADEMETVGLGSPSFAIASPFGFMELAGAIGEDVANSPVGIFNPDFSLEFQGWRTFGDVTAVEGSAVLSSASGRLYSDLSQTFQLSANAIELRFTLSAITLETLLGGLGDAIEVALINSETGVSLVGSAVSDSDSFLNLQANGVLNLASAISIVGRPDFVSGETVDIAQDLTFSVDLSAIDTNSVATLFFDLVTVSGGSSSVTVDDLVLEIDESVGNLPPVAVDDDFSGLEDSDITGNVLTNDSDAEGDEIFVSVVSNPGNGSVILLDDGSFTYTPDLNFFGTDSFTYQVSDSEADGNIATVTLTIEPVNDAPSFTSLGDVVVNEDAGTITITGWAFRISTGPANESDQTVSWLITHNSPSLLNLDPAIDQNGNLTLDLADNVSGEVIMTVSLVDNGGSANGGDSNTVSQNFTITILPVNDAPSFSPGEDQTVVQGSGAHTIEGWATAISPGPADESDQTVSFTVIVDRPELFAGAPAISADGTLTYTLADSASGVANLTVIAVDNGGVANGGSDRSATATFSITIQPVNQAPTFTIGPDQLVPGDGQAVVVENWITNISPGAESESSQTVTFLVEVDRPDLFEAGPTIDADGTLRYTLKSGAAGDVTISVRAMDDGGTANGGQDTSAVQTALISIFSPEPPTIQIGPGVSDPYWLQVNTLLDLPVTWTVGPGRTGVVTVSMGPDWTTITSDGNRLTGVPLRGHPGISLIEVTVTDDLGATATDTITVQLFRPWNVSARWLDELDFGPSRPS
ncbi:MAG: tandem-95 repeat protein, partial [Verrucomicrobiae bacterium]|nr:tandem-95 repeat protein [Verrucomicrobiae bacterium]